MSSGDLNIKYVAHLARLALTPEEEKTLGDQLGNIIGYIAKLKEVNIDGVEPTSHAVPLVNVTRPDEARDSFSNQEALLNAPSRGAGLFVVPKIIE